MVKVGQKYSSGNESGIDLEAGTVDIAGERLLDAKSTKLLERVRAGALEAAKANIPYLKTRMREYAIVKYRVVHNLSFEEIAKKPDIKMSTRGVINAFYRLKNPLIDPGDIQNHIEQSLRNTELTGELAMSLFDPKKPLTSIAALGHVLKAEKRKANLLGLDAPKNLRLTAGAGIFGMLASSEPLDPEMLKQIQALDPIIKPASRLEPRPEQVRESETVVETELIPDLDHSNNGAIHPNPDSLDEPAKALLLKVG